MFSVSISRNFVNKPAVRFSSAVLTVKKIVVFSEVSG